MEAICEIAPKPEELLIKKQGYCSPRRGIATELTRGQFYIPPGEDTKIAVVKIRNAKDTTDSDNGDGLDRFSWCPMWLYEEIEAWCEAEGIGEDEAIYPDSPSKYGKEIRRLRTQLAEQTGEDDWLEVTSHDFRRFYATNMVRRLNVPKPLVKYMGSWNSPGSMQPYLEARIPIDIQNELFKADPFFKESVLDVNVLKTMARFDQVDYDVLRDASLDEF